MLEARGKKNVGVHTEIEGNLEAKIKQTRTTSTTSFEYLLEAKNTTLFPQIQSKQAAKGTAPTFTGFASKATCGNVHLSQQKNDTNVINQQHKGTCSKIDFDINVTLVADEHDAEDHIENEDESWADYLDKARQKYFFHDDDTPTLR